ncbi:zinc finger protein Pegasus-like isoform X2 [Mobula birostris]|uniref:zinc finger protein Pegasus-like isoform X2 n=1 Tax=Mobula birostris TaxID=1983395 RepID=UPI003B27D9E1
MDEKRAVSVDFVKDFQEYLTQQTHHVNMISGSVGAEKESESLQTAGSESDQNGIHNASVEVSLDDGSGLINDGLERTYDGKLKCRYCNYASKGTARLTEHMRMHTGEKPHRCHLCPFASAYERHLEAHMRSHTAGQLSSLPPENQAPTSPEDVACRDEKPYVISQSTAPVVSTVASSVAQSSSPISPDACPTHNQQNFSPVAGPSSEHSVHTSTPSMTNSQPSTPTPPNQGQDPQLLHHCQHCDMYFADNILYTIHMGCHGYKNPFQCNICGCKCKNKYDFACHFARGQHKQN